MSEEALLIFKLVQEGKITPEQGVAFLDALKRDAPAPETAASSSDNPAGAAASGNSPWSSLLDMQQRLAEAQQRFAEMQARLGAAQAAGGASSPPPPPNASIKLPFGIGEFNLTQIIDDTLRGVSAVRSEAVIGAKKAARQAQKEARRFRQDAERMNKSLHIEVSVRPGSGGGGPYGGSAEASGRDERRFELRPGALLSVANPYGNVKIVGSSSAAAGAAVAAGDDADPAAAVSVTLEKRCCGVSRAAAAELLGRVGVEVAAGADPARGDILVSVARDGATERDLADAGLDVDLTLLVPAYAVVSAETASGAIHCESLAGGVRRAASESGDIRLLAIRPASAPGGSAEASDAEGSDTLIATRSGDIAVHQWHGRALEVESVSGETRLDVIGASALRVRTQSADISVREASVTGDLAISSVSGDAACSDVSAGACAVRTQSGDVELRRLSSESLTLESVSGDIEAAECRCADGRAVLRSISGDIEAKPLLARDVTLSTTSGDASVTLAPEFTGSVAGATVSGDIDLRVPAAYAADVTMNTHNGSLHCKTPLTPPARDPGEAQQYLAGRIGMGAAPESAGVAPGASISLQSVSGDLTIDRAVERA